MDSLFRGKGIVRDCRLRQLFELIDDAQPTPRLAGSDGIMENNGKRTRGVNEIVKVFILSVWIFSVHIGCSLQICGLHDPPLLLQLVPKGSLGVM